MTSLGLPEFAYALSVGLIVGVAFGVRRRCEMTKLSAVLVTHAFWCGIVGAIGLSLMIWLCDTGSVQSTKDDLFLLMLVAGGGISLAFGTPFAVATSWAISKIRSGRTEQRTTE